MSPLKMTPGQVLDARVDEVIMGGSNSMPPPYSTELSVALRVVDVMKKDGFATTLFMSPEVNRVSFVCSRGPCERHGNPHHNHHGAYEVSAETLEAAICRAALLAKGAK